MRYFVTVLVLFLFSSLSVTQALSQPLLPGEPFSADTVENGDSHPGWFTTAVDLSAGYRTDKLNWHIAGNRQGTSPNVRSELTWSDLRIYQLKLANRTVIKNRVYLRGHLDFGTVASGNNQDSDYNGDNRTQEISRSLNGVDGNHVWDASIGAGPRFSFFDSTLTVCPLLGYAVSEQDLNIVDGYQAIAKPPVTIGVGPIAGLDSRYQTRWKGPWFGVDLLFSTPCTSGPFKQVGVMFSGEYHWVDYSADANWNLREDFEHPVSFSHDAEGSGLAVGARILFETGNHWGFNVGMNIQEMTTDAGRDRIYYADGTTAETQLNEVRWRSFALEVGASYQF